MSHMIILASVLVLILAARVFLRFIGEYGVMIFLWHHLSGRHYGSGAHKTNATWFQRGDKCLVPGGRCSRWSYLPRIERAAIRTGGTLVFIVLLWAVTTHLFYVITISSIIAATGIAWFAVKTIRRLRRLYMNRGLAGPMGLALAEILRISESSAQDSVRLDPAWMTKKQGEIGRITLPARFRADPGQRELVGHLVTSRMPVDVELHWKTAVNPQYLSINAVVNPPTVVPFNDHVEYMHELPVGKVMLGLDRSSTPYIGTLGSESENPHFGISAQSGRGKSTNLVCTGAQILHQDNDATLLGIDPKMSSFEALEGLPGVTLANDPSDIENMWTSIDRYHADMMERLRIRKRNPGERFPISLLTIDEANAAADMWHKWWNGENSPKESKDSKTPPIWGAVAEIGWMGRAVSKNLIIVGQRLDSKATGGQGLRDSLGLIGLGGFRANQYRMLIEPNGTPPRAPRIIGRWLYFDSQETTWVQNLKPDIPSLRAYALNGRTEVKLIEVANDVHEPQRIDSGTRA